MLCTMWPTVPPPFTRGARIVGMVDRGDLLVDAALRERGSEPAALREVLGPVPRPEHVREASERVVVGVDAAGDRERPVDIRLVGSGEERLAVGGEHQSAVGGDG